MWSHSMIEGGYKISSHIKSLHSLRAVISKLKDGGKFIFISPFYIILMIAAELQSKSRHCLLIEASFLPLYCVHKINVCCYMFCSF